MDELNQRSGAKLASVGKGEARNFKGAFFVAAWQQDYGFCSGMEADCAPSGRRRTTRAFSHCSVCTVRVVRAVHGVCRACS